ncbi:MULTISPECIES: hypothetical protein [Nonomuraea]|uniref:Uncharacterized protein n=1 Tax=Nonomuraea ferruginea TaxID=46174 RepID=A0ABT4SR95_9ACTN|nr:hypothetical protein [Nonomuraea ferruginea]MDA0639580.1 hypothetical protein [Nonomuraea ferruginea]
MKADSPQVAFRLERGSTGFRHSRDSPLPETDPRACRTVWYAAARAACGQVGTFAEQQYPQNFHSATINDRDGVHVALFHAQYPLIAFVDDLRYWYADGFQDPPAWAASLNDCGFTVLSASLLMAPLAEADTAALSTAEWSQIKHWKPQTLGATLFNSWD